MEVVLSQFTKSLTKSGLMTTDEVQAFIDGLPPDKRPTDGKTLAQELVRHKKLTKFQAQAVYQGKTKGLRLGDYVVLDRIGQGGMGQVFKAKHRVMDRVVALKTLPAAATNSKLAVQRFHREVQVAARLVHPNIVTAYDAGESQGLHYLVMECVEGDDLGAAVKQRGRLPANTAIDYIIQAAKGLEYAHKQKVIHRDIKPSNLLLDREGTVKVLDMGLARLNQAIGPLDQTEQETLTGTGQVMGTIDFMPPEQAENTKKADERSDIYSLGCTLYYLLTGRAVYGGDTTVMKILAHRETAIPSLRTELPKVSEQLDAIYQKMVAKKPDDRYGSMTEVIAELEKCASPPEDIPETETFHGFTPKGKLAGDQSLNLDLPVISPVDEFRRGRPKKASKVKLEKNHIIYGSVALGVLLLLGLLGVVFSMRTPEGTLIVEVNQADAEISVDEGKVTLKSTSDKEPVEVEVEEGKHTLKITKGGFRTFASEFEITSGGEEVIRVTLVPLEKKVAAKAKPVPVVQPSSENWALEFDGTDDYVEIPSLRYDASHPVTFEAVVCPTEFKESTIVVVAQLCSLGGRNTSGSVDHPVWKWVSWGNVSEKIFVQQISEHTIDLGRSVHLATSYDGKDIRLYVNGVCQKRWLQRFKGGESSILGDREQVRLANVWGKPLPSWIGGQRRNDSKTWSHDGTIDEVRISNVARYTGDFTPQRRFEPDEHTMALYHFDEGSGDVLHDCSGNGHDGKIVGAKWVRVGEAESGEGKAGGVAEDADRRAAEWVLKNGGKVYLTHPSSKTGGSELSGTMPADSPQRYLGSETVVVDELEELPQEDFIVGGISLRGTEVTNEDLLLLVKLNSMSVLDLEGSRITDDGMQIIKNILTLKMLYLSHTPITDSGFALIANLPELESVSSGDTKVTATGLAVLTQLPKLHSLNLTGPMLNTETLGVLRKVSTLRDLFVYNLTDVHLTQLSLLQQLKRIEILESGNSYSEQGLANLRKALPNCEIALRAFNKRVVASSEKPESIEEPQPEPITHSWPEDAPPLAVAPFTPEEAKQYQKAWADYLGLPVEFTNSIGMKMVLIPPGEFMMGSTEEVKQRFLQETTAKGDEVGIKYIPGECPEHRVQVSAPFWMSCHEVTRHQFQDFVDETAYQTDAERNGQGGYGYLKGEWTQSPEFTWNTDLGLEQTDDHPVVNASWNDAVEFCRWLSHHTNAEYSLPNEAQWEYACRAGTKTIWHSGNEETSLRDYAWFETNAEGKTHLVGQLRPNAWGLHDMHGSVWEWCADRWQKDYYSLSPSIDPVGPDKGGIRVNRGGSWKDCAENARSARRIGNHPDRCDCHLGFRPVLLIDPNNPPKPTSQPPAESPTPEPNPTSEMQTEKDEADQTPKISWKLRHTLQGHTDEVVSVAFHPKGQMVASGSLDGTLKFWDVRVGKQLRSFQDLGKIRDLAISPNGVLLAVVGEFKGVKLMNIVTGQLASYLGSQDRSYGRTPIFSPDGSSLAFCAGDVWLYDLRTQQARGFQHGGKEYCVSVAFSPDGRLLALASRDGSLRLSSIATGKPIVPIASGRQEGGELTVAFSQDGTRVLAAGHGENTNVRIWWVRSGELHQTFDEPGAVKRPCRASEKADHC